MLRLVLSLRFILLFASFGATLGALLMFALGGAKLVEAGRLVLDGAAVRGTTAAILGATDAFLFGMVLVIFAYAIAFGFVFEMTPETRERLPAWMRVDGIGELKHTLVEVILVYLVVDFATDIAQENAHLSWEALILPVAILLIAAALRLLGGARRGGASHG